MEIQEIEKLFSQGKDDDKVRTVLNLEQESRNFETDQLLHEAGEITDIYTGLPPHYISDEVRLRFAEIKKRWNALFNERMAIKKLLQSIPPAPLKKREPDPETQAPERKAAEDLTDAECIQRLVDTGFIVQNKNIRDKTIYAKTRTANAPKIYKELLKMIDDGERAKRIMLNNISGVEAGLKEYLFRLAKSNKEQHSVRIRNIRLPR